MKAEILLISSAFLHALWNALSKKSTNPSVQISGILIFATIFTALFAAIAQIVHVPFFSSQSFPNSSSLYWGIASGFSEAGYFVTLALALSRSPMGTAYTIMRGGAMLLVYLISGLILGEKINAIILLGVSTVLLGLYFSSSRKKSDSNIKINYLWAYICAGFIASYHLCYSRSLHYDANPAMLFTLSLIIALPVLLIFNGQKNLIILKSLFKQNYLSIIFGGFICTTSFLLYLIGLKLAPAGFALTLRNSSIIFAQIFALFIGEKVGPIQWLGAILVAVGASLVTLG